jgi:hypothetical protein
VHEQDVRVIDAEDNLLEVHKVVPQSKRAADAMGNQPILDSARHIARQAKAEVTQEVLPAHCEQRQVYRVRIERVRAGDGRERSTHVAGHEV